MTQRNNQDQKKRENGSSNHQQQQQHLQSNGNFKQQDNLKQSPSVMQRTLNKLSLKRLSFTGKLGSDQTCKDEESDDGKFVGLKSRLAAALRFVNCNNTGPEAVKQLRTSLDAGGGPWDDMQYSETQNYVGTLDLFRYAKLRELIAIGCGILLMVYAASWQPISVFILAIMASLMGQYTKQMKWIKQLHQNNSNTNDGQQSISTTTLSSSLSVTEATTEASGSDGQLVQHNYNERAYYVGMINDCNSGNNNNNNLTIASDQDNGGIEQTPALSLSSSSSSSPLLAGLNYLASNGIGINVGQLDSAPAGLAAVPTLSPYTSYSFLNPLNSIVGPLFDLSGLSGHGGGKINYVPEGQVQDEHIRTAINELLDYESEQFLHKSFEINASAFLLALTQLLAFFLGMILITWAAKKQASRVKYLYFESCLHQEVTWFEAIDSASGSGSSLNGLVDKYQDGIGMKLALLCYFSGHVGLFALTAFYQMFSLAVFCMPFVLIIGIIIAYLSDWQANSIGQHALFAKRSLQLAEEIIAAIRTVFAFNGQQKEITRYSLSLEPVYRKSLLKHLYTALNTSLSKFSIFACFAFYCFYAKHLFPPYSDKANVHNKATILAVMRGAEVSIVNILISIPFLEALQQSKGSIARIFVAIERRSKINAASRDGLKLDEPTEAHHKNDAHATPAAASCQQHHINGNQLSGHSNDCSTKATSVGHVDVDKSATGINLAKFVNGANGRCVPPGANCCSSERSKSCASSDGGQQDWLPSISFRAVTFDYADRSGPTRRRSLLPFLNLAAGPFLDGYTYANNACTDSTSATTHTNNAPSSAHAAHATVRRKSLTSEVLQSSGPAAATTTASGVANQRRRSFIEQITDEAIDATEASPRPLALANGNNHHDGLHSSSQQQQQLEPAKRGSQSNLIRHMLGNEIRERQYGSEKQILNYFNLDIKPGQSVALVGPSGSGKSTVLALVQRLYDVISGQLLIGEHDIRQLNIAWLRNQISLVGQEPRLFDMSIAENIMLGLPNDEFERLVLSQVDVNGASGNRDSQIKLDNCDDGDDDDSDSDSDDDDDKSSSVSDIKGGRRRSKSSSSAGSSSSSGGSCSSGASAEANWRQLMQQVMEAARAANAHEFIVRLPSGYATRVGSGGVQLSGGQKQRIAIARALIRRPKILLLDECTSALDGESEAQVHAALKLASANRTTIIVAHRLETIRHVDLIAVMSQGQVVASGTHDELMSAASEPGAEDHAGAKIYKQLYEEQLNSRLTAAKSDDNLAALPASADGDTLTGTSGRLPATEQSSNGDGGADAGKKQVANSDEVAGGCKGADEDDKEDVDWGDDDGDNLSGSELSNRLRDRPSVWKLWQFVETPKWPALASVIVCLLAGLILPLNLIAHSYLFSVFAYNELDQIGEYLHVFGLLILSFSTFVFIVSFLQVMLPGYVGEKMSIGLRIKTMDSLLQKPMFYFDMDSNSAGSICDRFNGYISSLQNLAGTRVATMLEAVSTLTVGAIFGFGMSFALSTFCLSFALLVLITTIIESRIVERESALQQEFDGQLAHLMADALSNIKTIASLNRENYFIHKFASILKQRERGIGPVWTSLQAFLTSLKFVMPALSWSASMYYGSYLLASGRIDLQTIYIVCPVVLFAVNDTFRALVFLPELLKARKSIERLYKLNSEFSPQVLQTLTLAQQLEEQNRLHLQQLFAHAAYGATSGAPMKPHASAGAGSEPIHLDDGTDECVPRARRGSRNNGRGVGGDSDGDDYNYGEQCREKAGDAASRIGKPKKSISFAVGPPSVSPLVDIEQNPNGRCAPHQQSSNSDSAAGANLSNRRLSNLQSLPTYMRRKASRLNSLVPRSSTRGRIEFKHVEFSYPNRPSALVLEDFSLSIEPGESVALVGTSGSGKSTTVAILEKFYDYHAGDVTLDGCDLRLVEPNWVRSQIGLVQQEPCLLSYTIGDNIRYGDNSRFVSMSEVVEAARTANIHDFIMTLPDKYDTELSSSAYSSCQLSGGQRQRIAIARALIRNAPILIFDEATSALDNKSEQVVQDALNKAKRGKTNLTIAHRLATIKDADKIVVLRDGRVVEQGRHEQLIDRPNGFYKYLWERQGGGGGGGGSDGANPNGVSGF